MSLTKKYIYHVSHFSHRDNNQVKKNIYISATVLWLADLGGPPGLSKPWRRKVIFVNKPLQADGISDDNAQG